MTPGSIARRSLEVSPGERRQHDPGESESE
jgi:hypothetical protein